MGVFARFWRCGLLDTNSIINAEIKGFSMFGAVMSGDTSLVQISLSTILFWWPFGHDSCKLGSSFIRGL